MKQIGTPYKDYYYFDNLKVYNSLTKKYLRMNNNMFTLVNEEDKRVKVTLKELYYKVNKKVYCIDKIPNLQGEQWKEIENSSGNYFISNMGRIKSYKGYIAKILAIPTQKGYKRVSVDFGTGKTNYLIHKLVAQYFLPLPTKPFSEIHHKDFNSLNNKADNLVWVTKEEHKEIHREYDKEINKSNEKTNTNR